MSKRKTTWRRQPRAKRYWEDEARYLSPRKYRERQAPAPDTERFDAEAVASWFEKDAA